MGQQSSSPQLMVCEDGVEGDSVVVAEADPNSARKKNLIAKD